MSDRDEYIAGLRQLADWLEQNPAAAIPGYVADINLPLMHNPAVVDYAAATGLDVAYDEDGNASANVSFGPIIYRAYGYADWGQHLAQHEERRARSWAEENGMEIVPSDLPDDDDPYAESPDAGDDSACDCNGAWHARRQHCVDWPCPGCTRICPPEPGTEVTS